MFLNVPRKDRRWMECLTERVVFDDLDFRGCNFSYDARDLLQKVGSECHQLTNLSDDYNYPQLLSKHRRDRLTTIRDIKKHRYFSTMCVISTLPSPLMI